MEARLEHLASQAVYAAALFERALHDEGPWTMTWGPHEVEAVRVVEGDGVRFEAVFPEACYLQPPDPNVVLRCRGEMQAMRAIAHPGDAAFAVTWDLAARWLAHEQSG
jgi:hypothetical protein